MAANSICDIEVYVGTTRQTGSQFEIVNTGLVDKMPGIVGGEVLMPNPGGDDILIIRRTPLSRPLFEAGTMSPESFMNLQAQTMLNIAQDTYDQVWERLGKGTDGNWDAQALEGKNAAAATTDNSWVTFGQVKGLIGGGIQVETGPKRYKLTPDPDGSQTTWTITDSKNLTEESCFAIINGVVQDTDHYTINNAVTPNDIIFDEPPIGTEGIIRWITGTVVIDTLPDDSIYSRHIKDGEVYLVDLNAEVSATFWSASNFPNDAVATVNIQDSAVTEIKIDPNLLATIPSFGENGSGLATTRFELDGGGTDREVGVTYTNTGTEMLWVKAHFVETQGGNDRNLPELQMRADNASSWQSIDQWWGRRNESNGQRGQLQGFIKAGWQYRLAMASGNSSYILLKHWTETTFPV